MDTGPEAQQLATAAGITLTELAAYVDRATANAQMLMKRGMDLDTATTIAAKNSIERYRETNPTTHPRPAANPHSRINQERSK